MSQTAGVSCMTCREHGPLVGDYGLLGNPAIEPLRTCAVSGGEDSVPSFGYLYEGLAAVGLRRFDLDELAEWLRRHAGHRFAVDCEGSNEEVVELEEDEEVGEAAQKLWNEAPERLESALKRGEYIMARHSAECLTCGDGVMSSDTEPYHAFGRKPLGPVPVSLLLDRWAEWDAPWTYRLFGAVDPFMDYFPALLRFLRSHAGHEVAVELKAA